MESSQTEDPNIIARLISQNRSTSLDYSLRPNTPEITIGRLPTCTILVSNIRCSGVHCKIAIAKDNESENGKENENEEGTYKYRLTDSSSNGTYVNQNIVREK